MDLNINLPKNLKIILWKKKNNNLIYIINKNKKLKFYINNLNNLNFDKWSNNLILKNKEFDNKTKLKNKINNFLKSWDIFFFDKIKFKGKGFRIKSFKKIKLIKFYFGKSHKTFLFLKKIKKKRINKYKFLMYSINLNRLKNEIKIINFIKPINIYTLRGLRISRQIIFKRKGKKGTYI